MFLEAYRALNMPKKDHETRALGEGWGTLWNTKLGEVLGHTGPAVNNLFFVFTVVKIIQLFYSSLVILDKVSMTSHKKNTLFHSCEMSNRI